MENNLKFLYESNDGIVICIKLVPNSSHNKVVDYTDEYVRIKISSPPIENKANKELVLFLSDILNVNKSKIKLVAGDKSKLKKVLITNIKREYITQKFMFMLDFEKKENKG